MKEEIGADLTLRDLQRGIEALGCKSFKMFRRPGAWVASVYKDAMPGGTPHVVGMGPTITEAARQALHPVKG